jgi:ribonuclease BN (tRNA processing enzyme)
VRITVLGKSPAWQDAGGACSGYLVEADGRGLLLDCGPGVFGKLRRARDYAAVEAVVLSHLHADHVLDLVPYASALIYSPRGAAGELPRPALHVPPGGRAQLAGLCAAVGMDSGHLERAFALREYDPAGGVEAAGLRLRFQPVPHFVPTQAIEVAGDGGRLTYGADCGPNPQLSAFARDTDLLLLEATLPTPDPGDPPGHMTAEEAGALAREARARRLVITHMTDELDLDAARAAACAAFGGEVDVAREGASYEVPAGR